MHHVGLSQTGYLIESIYMRVCYLSVFKRDNSQNARAWNNLPSHLRLAQSADTFRRHLKTFLFHIFTMSLLGALIVLLHLRHRNLDFLDIDR